MEIRYIKWFYWFLTQRYITKVIPKLGAYEMNFLLTSIISVVIFRPDCSVQQIAEEEMEEEAMPVTILFQADGILKGRNNNTC